MMESVGYCLRNILLTRGLYVPNAGNAMRANVALVPEVVLLVEIWGIGSDNAHSDRMTEGIYMRPRYKGLRLPKEGDTPLLMPGGRAEEEIQVLGER